jgi:hypothetical protein
METMNVFQQCWKNWIPYGTAYFDLGEQAWLNELNQAIFSRLEKNLPAGVKVRSVATPAFLYYTEAAGGYGVDAHAGVVRSERIRLTGETFEEHVDSAVDQILKHVTGDVRTLFFFAPIAPLAPYLHDGSKNRVHMSVRMFATGETVDA